VPWNEAHDAFDQGPVGGENQHIVAGLEQCAGDRAEAAGRAGRDQDVVALERQAGLRPFALDDRVEQCRQPVHRRVAVHAGKVSDSQVFHPAACRWLHPGIADVQRVGLAGVALQPVCEPRVDRGRDSGEMAGGPGKTRHVVSCGDSQPGWKGDPARELYAKPGDALE
jgi:hypothetical protein